MKQETNGEVMGEEKAPELSEVEQVKVAAFGLDKPEVMSDSGYTPSTVTDYVLTVLNDQKYGHDIEWVRLNLGRSHLEQKEAAHDAVIREEQAKALATAHADLAWVKKWVARPGGATDDELDELRSYLSQSFTGTESEQNG